VLFVGDDWAEDHHDLEVQDEQGRVLGRCRVTAGVEGLAAFHGLVAEHLGEDEDPGGVLVGIEVDRGTWVSALNASGYQVYGVNPKLAARHREIVSISGAKDDKTDAHTLADMVRTRRHQLRQVAGDTELAAAVKVVARAHQTMVWERTRHLLRLRAALKEYYPAALGAYGELGVTAGTAGGLSSPDALELLAKAPTPAAGVRLTISQITAALKRARRRHVADKAARIQAALRAEQLSVPEVIASAYAATVRSQVAMLQTITTQIIELEGQVEAHFGRHPDAEILLSQPGIGIVSGARVLAEFGDDPDRYASAKARKNYAGTSPITRQSGKTKTVHGRYIYNRRLVDALHAQAMTAARNEPGAAAYYQRLRDRGVTHNTALHQLANRLVGIIHGCLKTRTVYDPMTAWAATPERHADTPAA
jgi:transposase/transposase IS116/IS110/IS902 family protein